MGRKKSIELSFDDLVLLRLGLSELKKTYGLLVSELCEEDSFDDAADFAEAITRINKLDDFLQRHYSCLS